MIAWGLKELESVFGWLLEASWQASVLALVVLLVQRLFHSRLNPRWRYALWLLVLVRLVLPVLPESTLSLFQFAPKPSPSFVDPVTEPLFLSAPPSSTQIAILPAEQPEPLSLYSLFALAWLAGALILFLLTWQVNRRFACQIGKSPEITDPRLVELFMVTKAELGIRRTVQLVESAQVESPAIMGLFHPILLLPTNVLAKFDATELRLIFLHELAHLKRGDVIAQGLIALLQIVHWFNPILWFAFRRMRTDREPATDALVLSRAGENEKERYGLMLIKLLEHFNQRHSLPTLVGILEDKDQFKQRFSLIARFTRGAYGWSLLGVFIIAILAAVCLTKNAIHPKIYTATAEIKIQPQSGDPTATLRGEIEIMQSKDILLPIINDLGLDKTWAQRDFKSSGNRLSPSLALDYMRKNVLNVDHLRGTTAIKISANSQDPQEAVAIANAVADRYKTMRDVEQDQREHDGENTLHDQITTERRQIEDRKAIVERLQKDLENKGVLPNDLKSANADPTLADYRKALQEYQEQQNILTAFNLRLQQVMADGRTSKSSVNIISRASPEPDRPPQATGPDNTPATNQPSADAVDKIPEGLIQVSAKVLQISEDDYEAHRSEIDAAAQKGDCVPLSHLKSFYLLSQPRVCTKSGEKAVMEAMRVLPYPIRYEKDKNEKMTPTDFARKNIGVTFPLTPVISNGKIIITGSLTVTTLQGWTSTDEKTFQPVFGNGGIPSIAMTLESGQTMGIYAPEPQADASDSMAGSGLEDTAYKPQGSKAPQRLFLFLTADSWSESGAPLQGETLTVRTFLAPPNLFARSDLKSTAAQNASLDVQQQLADRGIRFPAGATATFLPESSKLIVRNTPEQLDLIATIIEQQSKETPDILQIGAKIAEITTDAYSANHDMDNPASQDKAVIPTSDPKTSPTESESDFETLKKNLLLAKEDADSRQVLMKQMQNLSDDEFVNTMAAMGHEQSSITGLRSDALKQESAISNLLNQGFASDHPRILALKADLERTRQQIKEVIAGLRRAVAVDSQMADSRVALLAKEVAGANTAAQTTDAVPNTAAPPDKAPIDNNAASPISPALSSSTPAENPAKNQIEIQLKLAEITDDAYQAHQTAIDAGVNKGGIALITLLNNLKGVSLVSAPSVTTQPGVKATIDMVREFPYPVSFDNPRYRSASNGNPGLYVPPIPQEFATKDIGVSAEIKASIDNEDSPDHGKIIFNGKLNVTDFVGFIKIEGFKENGPAGGGMPSFNTSETHFFEALDDNQLKAIWIPGVRYDEQTVANLLASGNKVSSNDIGKKRLLLFISARLVKKDN